VGRTVVVWLGAGERTLGARSWCIQLLLVALVGNEREEGSLRPGVLAWLGAVVTCSWWWRSFLWVRVVVVWGWRCPRCVVGLGGGGVFPLVASRVGVGVGFGCGQ